MTLKEVTEAETYFNGNDADFLTWTHCCLAAKQMWRATRRDQFLIKVEEKQNALAEAAGHAMLFLQYLWVIPKTWENHYIYNIDRSDSSCIKTFAATERQAWSLIAEYYERRETYFKDPLKRHFEVNRILHRNQASTATPFNPHLVNRNN